MGNFRFKLIFALLILSLGGCSQGSPANALLPEPNAANLPQSVPAAELPTVIASSSPISDASPTTSAAPNSTSFASSSLATPPNIMQGATSTPSQTNGAWKTYVNAGWQVAIDYPADWAASEKGNNVTFVSPTGATIQLTTVDTGALSPQDFLNNNADLPNTRCTSRTNAHGVMQRTCFDTISFSTTADLILQSQKGPAHLLELGTGRRTGDVPVLNEMLATVRPAS